MSLTVLFEDHHLIAVDKPAGLPTQAPPGLDSLEARVKDYIKEKYAKPAGVYLGVPHRLDRPVGGVVLFCRNTKAARRVSQQFENRTVRKVYWALIPDGPIEPAGTWDDWLRKVPDEARAEVFAEGTAGAKRAIADYRIASRFEEFILLELAPQTGRMHQLRIQAASRGHPILGDTLYGSTAPFVKDDPQRIALHARTLIVEHPFRKVPLELTAEPDGTWLSFEKSRDGAPDV